MDVSISLRGKGVKLSAFLLRLLLHPAAVDKIIKTRYCSLEFSTPREISRISFGAFVHREDKQSSNESLKIDNE